MTVERHLLPGDVIQFTYTNWKGRIATRTVKYERMTIGGSQMPDASPGSLELYLRGYDLDKQADRCYHVSGIRQGSIEYYSGHGLSKPCATISIDCGCDPDQGCGIKETIIEEDSNA